MITTTDPGSMTAEDRRTEVAGLLAGGGSDKGSGVFYTWRARIRGRVFYTW